MKNSLLLIFSISFLLFVGCTKDTGVIKVTYFEANAIYGDLDEIRSQAVNHEPREIKNPGKIYVAEDLILIGEEEIGIHVVDNSDPSNPKSVNFINVPGNREFFVKEGLLFAESYYDIIKFDISNPLNVIMIDRANNVFNDEFKNNEGETLLGFNFEEVTREVDENSDLYKEIRSQENTVYYDFTKNIIPRSAVPASFAGNSNQSSGTVNRMTKHGDHVYIVGRYDLNIIEDINSFEKIAQIQDAGDEMETIFPYKENLFVGSRSSMEIFDITNPERPIHKYRFEHASSCDPVLPHENVAYISLRTADFSPCPGNTNAIVVLDIENLENPNEVDEIGMRSPYGMALINELLFVGEGENGLSVFDTQDPLHPVHVLYDASVKAYDIIEHPTRTDLILIAGPNGLEQYIIDESLGMELEGRISF